MQNKKLSNKFKFKFKFNKLTCSSSWIEAASGSPSATRATIVIKTMMLDQFPTGRRFAEEKRKI